MFVDDKSHLKIPIHFKLGKTSRGIRVETSLDKIPEDKRAEYKTVVFEMRPITWKMSNDLMRECRYKNMQTGTDDIDWIKYKEQKLKMVVAGWDAKTDDSKAIPVTEDAIMKLHPLIAETLLSLYDRESYLDEDSKA